uniref:BH4_AAA_HYDROXYL_2 domain-containing protein n=1 Tax=Steinernema glaseri TaxID=37863 RepID=A0A1I8AR75_9BILA
MAEQKRISMRRDSLVRQASEDRQAIEGLKRKNTQNHRQQLEKTRGRRVSLEGSMYIHSISLQILEKLNDEGVDLIWSSAEDEQMNFNVFLSPTPSGKSHPPQEIRYTQAGITVAHLETRLVKKYDTIDENDEETSLSEDKPPASRDMVSDKQRQFEILFDCVGTKSAFLDAATKIVIENAVKKFELYNAVEKARPSIPWFPRHVSDLDKCAHVVTKYEPTTDPRHPGHGDDAYIARRAALNQIANDYRHGHAIPHVDYSDAEHETWAAVYARLKSLHESHTCKEYRENLRKMEEAGVITPYKIPQLSDINHYLQQRTGFQLRPCGGLLSARDFLASLAFRVFQATQYVRHTESPHHSPEPDVIHEILGHCPMFADPVMAQFSQEIGLLSLGATDEQIEQLATVYWFIIEFGLCEEDGKLKAIGAGLISAYGELIHACSDTPEHRAFEPATTALQPYEDVDYQPIYFVAKSIFDAMSRLRQYAKSFSKPFSVMYDPFTQTVDVIDQPRQLERWMEKLKTDLSTLTDAFDTMSTKKD